MQNVGNSIILFSFNKGQQGSHIFILIIYAMYLKSEKIM